MVLSMNSQTHYIMIMIMTLMILSLGAAYRSSNVRSQSTQLSVGTLVPKTIRCTRPHKIS